MNGVGEYLAEGVYRTEFFFDVGREYGHARFGDANLCLERFERLRKSRAFVFLDVETTGLDARLGAYAFMVGLGFPGRETFRVMQLFLSDPLHERTWFEELVACVPYDAALVTYNGATFDLPFLRERNRILGLGKDLFITHEHIDLLFAARRLFKKQIGSCTLGNVESRILGVRRDEQDVPGRHIPALYGRFLRTRDAGPLSGVFYHNRLDLLSLSVLLEKIAEF